jgi:hypothetical protein
MLVTAEEFNRAVADRIEREPFQPFVIELLNGARLDIDRRFTIAIRDGMASCFIRGRLVPRIRWNEVRQVVDIGTNAASASER